MNSQVLVLGDPLSSRLIGTDLKAIGFHPVFPPEDLRCDRFGLEDRKASIRQSIEYFAQNSDPSSWVHPGAGFWAEDPEIPALGSSQQLQVLAPGTKCLSLFQSRLNLLMLAEQLGIPTLLLSSDPIYSVREIIRFSVRGRIPFPFVMKSAKAAGRYGVFVLHDVDSLKNDLELWCEQLRWSVGEVILFPERYLEGARMFSLPFSRSSTGELQFYPLTDISLQMRNRNLVELCKPGLVSDGVLKDMKRWSVLLLENADFIGLGTLEFVFNGKSAFFLGGQARLNGGYPLWEKIGSERAVQKQFEVYSGQKLEKKLIRNSSSSSGVWARVYAEDSLYLLPRAGRIDEQSGGNHTVFGYSSGSVVLSDSSGWLAGVSAFSEENTIPLESLRSEVSDLWISGTVQTNDRFLSEVLDHPWIREGIYHLGTLDEEFLPQMAPPASWVDLGCSLAKHFKEKSRFSLEKEEPSCWLVSEQWLRKSSQLGSPEWVHTPELFLDESNSNHFLSGLVRHHGQNLKVFVCQETPLVSEKQDFGADERRFIVRIEKWILPIRQFVPILSSRRPSSEQSARKVKRLNAIASGRVQSLRVRQSSFSEAHQPLVLLESMGSFIEHSVPTAVKIEKWLVEYGQQVGAGQTLALISVSGGRSGKTAFTSAPEKSNLPQ